MRGRQEAADDSLQHGRGVHEPVQAAGDVGRVRESDPRLLEQPGQQRPGAHLAAGRGERTCDESGELVVDRHPGHRPHRHEVIVLHDQVASRGNRVPEPAEHGDPLREVEEHQTCVDEVVGSTGNRGVTTQVVGVELALSVTLVAQPRNAVRAQGLVDVDTHDPPPWTDPLGQLTHRHTGSGAGVQATRARSWIHPVQHPLGGTLPDLCLPAHSLVLLLRGAQHVGRAGLGSDGHRASRCGSRFVHHDLRSDPDSSASWSGPRCFDNAMDTVGAPGTD